MEKYSVKDIIKYVSELVDEDELLQDVAVEGEVEDFTYHGSGHVYVTIKDAAAKIKVTLFSSYKARGLRFRLEKGQKVTVYGTVGIYASYIQIKATKIEQQGVGDIYQQYLRLKAQLEAEGLFDEAHKKTIPEYPKSIGIISSSTAAGLEDYLDILHKRNPYVPHYLYDTLLQGNGAAEAIVRAVEYVDRQNFDVIVIVRGGGPKGDMDVFDDERVVRAIYNANTPIITGVGHHKDWSLSDLAADARGITPTETAEKTVKDLMEIIRRLNYMRNIMDSRAKNIVESKKGDMLRLDSRMRSAMSRLFATKQTRLHSLENQLMRLSPAAKLERQKKQLSDTENRLRNAANKKYNESKHRYEILTTKLQGLSPMAKLVGGFGYVEVGGKPLLDIETAKVGDTMQVTVEKGIVKADVVEVLKQTIE